jgi:[CysO sulfur-carrier protein]-S-L-cysteine hydrolase
LVVDDVGPIGAHAAAAPISDAGEHPGPPTAPLPATMVQQLIDHARGGYPNEACGVIVGDRPAAEGGQALRFVPTTNAAASPYRYEIDSRDLLRLTIETDDRDETFWAIVHSHPQTAARPSPTDVGLALYPDALYVLISLAEPGRDPAAADPAAGDPASPSPTIRAWRILDGRVHEVVLEVTE